MATRQLKTLWYLAFNNEHKICIFWHLKFPLEKCMEKILVGMNYLSFLVLPPFLPIFCNLNSDKTQLFCGKWRTPLWHKAVVMRNCGGIYGAISFPTVLPVFKFLRAGSDRDLYLHLNKSPSQAVHCNSTPMRMLRSLSILLTSVSLSFHYLNQ